MSYDTINTIEAVNLFHTFMKPDSHKQIICLTGDGKMGKSHLLTKVFPILAQQNYQARLAVLDISHQFHTVPDILSQACTQLGDEHFEGYYTAEKDWANRPKVDVKGLIATFSRVGVTARDSFDDIHHRDRNLTAQFVKDLGKLGDKLALFLFDSVDRANEEMKMWLIETFLIPLSRVSTARVVIAGRTLPNPHGSYGTRCYQYQLAPIKEIEAYMAYCQHAVPGLSEQSIRTLIHAFDYIPGFFVEVLPKFHPQRFPNG